MEQYQNALDVLKKPINVPYELETEKVGGLFNKETQETGNVVIDKNEFDLLQEQVASLNSLLMIMNILKAERL